MRVSHCRTGRSWTSGEYIQLERITVVPLYFASERLVVRRANTWTMLDDDRLPLNEGETPELRKVRFRTLGYYPISGAIESEAGSIEDIITEKQAARFSERRAA
jgi:sulfate adenylyltransferase subunit 2